MFHKSFFTHGTLGLALAASVFIGCQDFLGEDKGPSAVPSSTSDDVLHAAKETQLQDSVQEASVKSPDTTQKVAVTNPVDSVTLCKQLSANIQAQPQGDKEALNQSIAVFNENSCGAILDALRFPTPPIDSALRCKNIETMLVTLDPASPKYPYYQDIVATECAKAVDMPAPAPVKPEPAKPVQPSPPPASTILSPEQEVCIDLWNQMQSKIENYMEVKYKYGGMNCDLILGDAKPAPPPFVPPTIEERCQMYRKNLTETQPTGDPKYAAYLAEMAITCANYP